MTRAVGTPSGAGDPGSAARGRGRTATNGLRLERVWTTAGVHPYDEVTWERRDVVMTNWRDGSVNFEQRGVEFPDFWCINATNIVTTKYFRGAAGTPQRESSLRTLLQTRLLGTLVDAHANPDQAHGDITDHLCGMLATLEAIEQRLEWQEQVLRELLTWARTWDNDGVVQADTAPPG